MLTLVRMVARGLLIAMAVVLTVVALITAGLRIMPLHLEGNAELTKWLPLPEGVDLIAKRLEIGLDGRNLVIDVDRMNVFQQQGDSDTQRSLFTLARGRIKLDLLRSLQLHQPAFNQLDLDRPAFSLYQRPDGRWWADDEDDQSDTFSQEDLKRWLVNIAGSRARISEGSVELFGLHDHHRIDIPSAVLVADSNGDTVLQAAAVTDYAQRAGISLNANLSPEGDTSGQAELRGDAKQISAVASMFSASAHYEFSAQGDLHFQLGWKGTQSAEVRSSLDLDKLHIGRTDDPSRRADLAALSTALYARYDDHRWQGRFAKMDAEDSHGKALALPAFGTVQGNDEQLSVLLPAFRLEPANLAWPLLPFSERLRQTYIDLHPSGQVNKARLDLDLRPDVAARDRLRIRADLSGATMNSHEEIPALGPVSGGVDTTLRFGRAWVKGDDVLGLNMPTVFETRWPLESLSGKLSWELNDNYVKMGGSDIHFVRDGANASGDFFLDLPDHHHNHFSFDLAFENAKVRSARDWVPLRVMGKSLGDWLVENVHSGEVPKGKISMSMVFGAPEGHPELEKHVDFGDPKSGNRLLLDLDVRNATLGYLEGWQPVTKVDGSLHLDGENMRGAIHRAELNGLKGGEGNFSLHDDLLSLDAPVEGDAGQLLDVLKRAPFDKSELNTQFSRWEANGPLKGNIRLRLPFGGEHDGQVDFTAQGDIAHANATLVASALKFSDISSNVKLHMLGDNVGINGNAHGRVFGGPVNADFALNNGVGNLDFNGEADALESMKWLHLSGLAPDTYGSTRYGGAMRMSRDGVVTLNVDSDSRGVKVPLPEPLGKDPEDPRTMRLRMDLTNGVGNVVIDNLVKARWRDQMRQGQVWVEHWPEQPEWQPRSGWSITMDNARLDPGAWMKTLQGVEFDHVGKQVPSEAKPGSEENPIVINEVRFDTDCLVIDDECLTDVHAHGQMTDDVWNASLRSRYTNGTAQWDPNAPMPITVKLNELNLNPMLDALQRASEKNADKPPERFTLYDQAVTVDSPSEPLAAFPEKASSLPAGTLNIANIIARDQRGALNATWHTADNALSLDTLEAELAGTKLKGSLSWLPAGEASVTQGSVNVKLGNIAKLLNLLDLENMATTRDGKIETGFAWPGAPWQPQLDSVSGNLGLDIGPGNIVALNLSSARLMGLLNFDNIFRRLRLDFSDVTEHGTAFNSIAGKATLTDGVLKHVEPLLIKAPSTTFTVDGNVDLINQRLNEHLAIRLPVSQTLPLAALAVGAPEIGGALLALHLAFGGWLNQVTELHYAINGGWLAPNITKETVDE
ncbi:YhdP family phospholipid transporter [Carnimonas bestiolae]|uniref:YhdP family phospholipid transporter n=1 Tax=Carnimonas bestiolae TaxID=3402172 RepID=UPI003EDC58E2